MNIDELAARDAAERERLRAQAIADTRRAIARRLAAHAPVDALQRHLTRLEAQA